MRLRHRRHHIPLVLLAFLSLASAAPPPPATKVDVTKAVGAAVDSAKNAIVGSSTTTGSDVTQASASDKSKVEVGSKVAPVDGKDGKPHAGPWVGVAGDREKTTTAAEESGKKEAPAGHKPAPRPMTETAIPKVNDGVMDDPNRETPKKGTTGTEGGVSEKDRDRKAQEGQTGERTEKKPDPPKEARPLPHSEEQKIREKEGVVEDVMEGAVEGVQDGKGSSKDAEEVELPGGLAKPVDLPAKPHDAPPPTPPSSSLKTDPLNPIKPDTAFDNVIGPPTTSIPGATNGLIQPLHSLFLALTMILFSEIGDKTFLIAALMAMKHPRLLVFSAAFSALIAMTILSALLGHAVPTLIPKRYTNILAALLFLVFGAKMLLEGWKMHPEDNPSEEMKEVELELEEREHLARKYSNHKGRHRSGSFMNHPYILESGGARRPRRSESKGNTPRKSRTGSRLPSPPQSPPASSSSSPSRSPSPTSLSSRSRATLPSRNTLRNILGGLNNLLSFLLSPAWVQTFVMTFLGEWGDRSQIATIAMAAGQDYWWVTAGAVTGHGLCTAAAVLGGRAIAGKVSLRVVTLGGALTFLAFGLIYLVEAMYYTV